MHAIATPNALDGISREPVHCRTLRCWNMWGLYRRALGLAGFVAVFPLVAGGMAVTQVRAAETPAALVKAAQAEGELMLYASVSEGQIKAILTGFEKKFGIKGTYLRLVSTPLIQRFVTANDAGSNEADVFLDSSPTAFEMYPQWFAPLNARSVPSVSKWPTKWLGEKKVTVQTSAMVVQYNTDQVSRAGVPKTWSEVLDPKWKGKILLTDPRISNTYLGWLDAMERNLGKEFIRKLAKQDFKLTQSGAAGAQMVAAGAYALNFPAYASFSVPLKKKKAPIESQVMSGPEAVNQTSVAVVAKAKHPQVARLFVSWLISEDGLQNTCQAYPVSSPGDPDGKFGCVPLKNPEVVNYAVPEARKQELLREIGLAAR